MLLNGGLLYRISYPDVGIQYTRLRNWLPPANNKVMTRGAEEILASFAYRSHEYSVPFGSVGSNTRIAKIVIISNNHHLIGPL
jgi:hypothetical protein